MPLSLGGRRTMEAPESDENIAFNFHGFPGPRR